MDRPLSGVDSAGLRRPRARDHRLRQRLGGRHAERDRRPRGPVDPLRAQRRVRDRDQPCVRALARPLRLPAQSRLRARAGSVEARARFSGGASESRGCRAAAGERRWRLAARVPVAAAADVLVARGGDLRRGALLPARDGAASRPPPRSRPAAARGAAGRRGADDPPRGVRGDRPTRRAVLARLVRGRRLLRPSRRGRKRGLGRSGGFRAARRRREPRVPLVRELPGALVPQHVAVRAEVAPSRRSRGAALDDHYRDGGPGGRGADRCRAPRRGAAPRRARVRDGPRESVSPMARVSLILVTWNSARFLPRCLDGIAQQTFRDIEVIAVDNGSADDSVAIVRAKFPDATIVRNSGNEGFSRAVNQGVARATGEFVQLVNPDAYLGPEYVAKLVEALQQEGFGSATGKLMRADGPGVDSKGIRMTRTGRHFDIEEGEEREVFGVAGAAAMYRMSFIGDVTLSDGQFLDEDFFTYREDADVAWRGRLFGRG